MYDLTQYDVTIFVRSAPSLGVIRITMLCIALSPSFLFAISNLGPTYEDISLVTASKSNNCRVAFMKGITLTTSSKVICATYKLALESCARPESRNVSVTSHSCLARAFNL